MDAGIFTLATEDYKRDVDPITDYIKQAAFYLHKNTGKTIDECISFIRDGLKAKKFKDVKDPEVVYLHRDETGDRAERTTTLTKYLYSSLRAKELIAPTMTTYIPKHVKVSLLETYIKDNIKARSVAKKLSFALKNAGKKEEATIKTIEQTYKKLNNNAISGAHVSKSTPLNNKTAHSTLTSNCRVVAGLGNANNEKFVTGNRHYWSHKIVMFNLVSITSDSNYALIGEIVNKYNLYIPTIDDVMDCIKYSTDLYWNNALALDDIRKFVVTLNDLERVAFVYTGDLYHIKKHNESLVRDLIGRMSEKVVGGFENGLDTIYKLEESYVNLAHQICTAEVKGRGKDYASIEKDGNLGTVINTTLNVSKVLTDYSLFIKAFFVTKHMPASVAYLPNSIRRAVVTSDTDSTIFTVQDWVKWYYGDYVQNDLASPIAGVVVFLTAQTITHTLAQMSANFGFAKDDLHTMAMKSEFYWPVFVNTSVGKHYFALCEIQEGNVFSKFEREVKGVHLKSSNSPKIITEAATTLMDKILKDTLEGKKLELKYFLTEVANIERNIRTSIMNNEITYFRLSKIKSPESYTKTEEGSPYQHHILWEQVFSEKYGSIAKPPYSVIKIPTILGNKTDLKNWLDTIVDTDLKTKLAEWLKVFNKTSLPTMYISVDYVMSKGIPIELASIIDIRRITMDICNVFYMLLESLGYFVKEDSIVSDFY